MKPIQSPGTQNNYDLDMRAGQPFVINAWNLHRLEADQLLTEPQHWTTLDYTKIEQPNISSNLTWQVEHSGTAHGFCVWFDTVLLDEIGFSNAPGKSEIFYNMAFFPWSEPVGVTIGDTVSVLLQANLVDDTLHLELDNHNSHSRVTPS